MSKQDCAVFTIAQDEHRFLPIWLDHYGKWFKPEDIFVLDHDSRVVGGGQHNTVPIHRDKSFDHAWLNSIVAEFQKFLLMSYRCVIFAEADEIIAADPRAELNDLRKAVDWLLQSRLMSMRCRGYEVVHDRRTEPAIDWQKPLLAQRSLWSPSDLYSKTLISKVPLDWTLGFHTTTNVSSALVADGTLLLHLHRLDFDYCFERNHKNVSRKWSEMDVRNGAGFQNRIMNQDELADWFYHPDRFGLEPLRLQDIPQEVKGIL